MRSRSSVVLDVLIVLTTGVAVWAGGGNVLFHLTADLGCGVDRPAPGFVGCAGVPRGAWPSWVLSALMGIAVAVMLLAIARGWVRGHTVGLALAGSGTVLVFAALIGRIDAPYTVQAICYPDGHGGCLDYAVPSGTWALRATIGAVTGIVLFALAALRGRRAR
ncbi:MAG: hypothetical protein MUP36_02660 [Demequinaceae bacterium]|nr:hypothetical protein [Demequinaceae bacterium]